MGRGTLSAALVLILIIKKNGKLVVSGSASLHYYIASNLAVSLLYNQQAAYLQLNNNWARGLKSKRPVCFWVGNAHCYAHSQAQANREAIFYFGYLFFMVSCFIVLIFSLCRWTQTRGSSSCFIYFFVFFYRKSKRNKNKTRAKEANVLRLKK